MKVGRHVLEPVLPFPVLHVAKLAVFGVMLTGLDLVPIGQRWQELGLRVVDPNPATSEATRETFSHW